MTGKKWEEAGEEGICDGLHGSARLGGMPHTHLVTARGPWRKGEGEGEGYKGFCGMAVQIGEDAYKMADGGWSSDIREDGLPCWLQ